MHTPEDMTPAQRELEEALRGLRPGAPGQDAVALAYRMGEAVGARRSRRWQASSAILGAALVAGVALVTWRQWPAAPAPGARTLAAVPGTEQGIPPRDLDRPSRAPAPLDGLYLTSAYMRLRERSLRMGVGVLGETAPSEVVEMKSPVVGAVGAPRRTGGPSQFQLFWEAFHAGGRM